MVVTPRPVALGEVVRASEVVLSKVAVRQHPPRVGVEADRPERPTSAVLVRLIRLGQWNPLADRKSAEVGRCTTTRGGASSAALSREPAVGARGTPTNPVCRSLRTATFGHLAVGHLGLGAIDGLVAEMAASML